MKSNPELSAVNVAVLYQLLRNVPGHVDRNSEANTNIACHANDGGIDADEFAAQADQRTTGVTWIDRSVGLDEIFIALDAETAPTERAYNAKRNRLSKRERVADCDDIIPHLKLVGIPQRYRHQNSLRAP